MATISAEHRLNQSAPGRLGEQQRASRGGPSGATPTSPGLHASPPPQFDGGGDRPATTAAPIHGLSTTFANEHLVEEVETLLRTVLEEVQFVSWRSRLGFLQTHEGGVPTVCVVVLIAVAAYTLDWHVFGEAALVIPSHVLAWYISFRLPRVEQLRAISHLRECIQRFVSSEDAFTVNRDSGDGAGDKETEPPSSFCVGVMRDRAWRRVPYNMIVEGDIFKLRDGDTFPCDAERLVVRGLGSDSLLAEQTPQEIWHAGDTFESLPGAGGRAKLVVGSFRALSTACLPMVKMFLQSRQSNKDGRNDTAFFELMDTVRSRLKGISVAAFLVTVTAFGLWFLEGDVSQQGVEWHLHRMLLPLRLMLCLVPLMPAILLQTTDVWGNARIQSLFEWHAGLADEEKQAEGGGPLEERNPGSGEIDASRVPLRRQLKELLDILRQGLDGPSNLMHTLNSTTVVSFCDKEGLLTDTCSSVKEVCVFEPEKADKAAKASQAEAARNISATSITSHMSASASALATSESIDEAVPQAAFNTTVLDVQHEAGSPSGIRFEFQEWRHLIPLLKPLGLAMAVSRKPRDVAVEYGSSVSPHDLSINDLLSAMRRGTAAAMHDCLCNVSRLIGFRDEVLMGFPDVKVCVELCRPKKKEAVRVVHPALPVLVSTEIQKASTLVGDAQSEPVTGSQSRRPSSDSSAKAEGQGPKGDEDPAKPRQGCPTNFSQTMMTWLVQDTREDSFQMFSKAKPKRLLTKCSHYFNGSKIVKLSDANKESLLRLVLQWKSSGLTSVAYSYRPLNTRVELDEKARLAKSSFLCVSEGPDGSRELLVGAGDGGSEPQLAELQGDQVLLGMVGLKCCASMETAGYAKALEDAGIRFQVFSAEGEKRTKTLGQQLGLDTSWNCLVSLAPKEKEDQATNWMGEVVLPSGIEDIRKHLVDIDNVPLLVPLYSSATPWRTREMISILKDNAEIVTVVGSALQPNFEIFRQANISVSVLVDAVPQCTRCRGRREPPPGDPNRADLMSVSMVERAEFQLSADLTSLPCALQARHTYSEGEQRTLSVLFNAIKEARRCVDCILMVIIHYICGAVQLAVVVFLQALFCLPSPLEGFHLLSFLLVLLPIISLCLLFNAASKTIMKELPLKKADEKTNAQPGRLMVIYALRCIPTSIVIIVGFVHDLHRMFDWQLRQLKHPLLQPIENQVALPEWVDAVTRNCDGFDWSWWFTGRWPKCVAAMSGITHEIDYRSRGPWDQGKSGQRLTDTLEAGCALVHAQQTCAILFVIYEVTMAFTFLDRYDSLWTRGPLSNRVLVSLTIVALLVHAAASISVIAAACGEFHEVMVPPWWIWLLYVCLWPALAVAVSERLKRGDREYHRKLQNKLKVFFDTKLGMWSPR